MASYNHVDPILQSDKVRPDDFNYELPKERIAEYPAEPRDSAKLMVVNREDGSIEHRVFLELPDLLEPGDVIVLNNTKVFPAKFRATKEDSGDPIQVFLLRELNMNTWEILVDPPRKVRVGNTLIFSDNIQCDVIDNTVSSGRVVQFHGDGEEVKIELEKIGMAPLPPYVDRATEPKDKEIYQTIFAQRQGSVVAPSAGLHFTDSVLKKLKKNGINVAYVTLHLGLDSYQPITISDLSSFDMQTEQFIISEESAKLINKAKNSDNRIVAVGATVVRALESSHFEGEKVVPNDNWTDLFVFPPFHFQIVDTLISNFHQPQSATMVLQSSFYNRDGLMEAYKSALDNDYRFLGLGDSMVML